MLSAFAQAFRTPDLRRKLLFTLFIMALFRAGTFIPTPGVSVHNINQCMAQSEGAGLLDLVNLFSGGALMQLSIFALGIMPYITASIIIQLLRVVVPRFDDLHKEGQAGQAKLTQYTRYLTIFLSVMQATGFISLARSGRMFPGCQEKIIPNESVWVFIVMIIVMTAGSSCIMWLGEVITDKGIGNGMSLLIFTSIIARLPSQLFNIGATAENGVIKVLGIIALIMAITLAIVFVEQAMRRIPVQYAKRMVGSRMYGGSATYIPIKINMSGVIPVIFSTSILAMPMMIAQFGDPTKPWVQFIMRYFQQRSWLYLLLDALLIIFFSFFYTQITFDPDEVADNMKKYGGFVPGVRAGRPTADLLRYIINRITTAGSLYLVLVAMIPVLALIPMGITQGQLPFGGTTLLIIVGVGLQTVKEVNAQLRQHHYEGFLR
ncbi:preprotein translocase subunit SecY [Boudabousia liubingyangii]|uniref:Protein translocase subunit SecY n=1 Tax=Boudabousia liubingyangii TaxID=1921764 RepID=A0A1Q5PQ55_9ACTO|nr:preprotein translocase subunit SecY [Boudabousia liubingyangii]OKL48234.1 preprotein translocase subunit SecY [Boudabousia liubingyangii]OKL49731.1 preprotein translocase subunit SecY [Boudabousia liubingyangii]